MTPMFTPPAMEYDAPPILVGAQGPKMAEMVGAVADGLLVLPFHSQRYVESVTFEAVARGRISGANERSFEVVCGAIVGLGLDEASLRVANDGVRGLLGFYGSTPAYAPVLEAEGLGHLHEQLRAAVRRGDWAGLMTLVPDELVNAVATVGTPKDVAVRLAERFGGVADRLALFIPHSVDDAALGQLLGELRTREVRGRSW
jgi:probable F420-dependent oxidoreductase